jgi:membrane associated rhomboid family serine protease
MVVGLHIVCQPENSVTDQPELNTDEQIPAEKAEPIINLPVAVWGLIAVLVAVHVGLWLAGPNTQLIAQAYLAFDTRRFGMIVRPDLPFQAYWTMLTYALLHADAVHLGSNCLWLAIFSKPVATWMGWWRYLTIFCVSVVAGAAAGLAVHWGETVILVGASAGVSGILGAAIPIMYGGDNRGPGVPVGIMSYFRPLTFKQLLINKRALIFAAVWLGLNMLTATSQYMTGTAFLEERVIAWESHLGGFVAGLIAFYLLDRKRV